MKRWPAVGCVLAVLWVFVSGAPLTPLGLLGQFVFGLAVGFAIAYATRDLYAEEIDVPRAVRVVPEATLYLFVFLRELITANLDVAYRVLSPSLPIEPDVVAVPLRVENPVAITTIANSITLTPGTLTMDYDEETNTLYVHAITGQSDYDAVVDPIRAWEDLALIIFDEEVEPEEAAPPRPGGGVRGD
ncbi:Na+/H+ antiporter subunit E [Halomarina pelagica]|uniref:Na+/H+ antiporter subunit E n=1 Tax=Halomarina pelagica TaxID=2961599 RepID=UPI0020C56C28|nr:Na+/H+ antiporter subunit E [Halomarina sp. BND7]